MRYRVKDYSVSVSNNTVTLSFEVPDGMIINIDPEDGSLDPADERYIKESVRLIIDETNKIGLCSSMRKDSIANIEAQGVQGESTADIIYLEISIPQGKTVASTDEFTIEFDWGESLGDVDAVLEYMQQGGVPTIEAIAKEATIGTTADSSVATTIFGWLKVIWDKLVGIVTTYPYAKEATLTDATNGLPAIKSLASSAASDAAAAKVAAQGITGYALQGSDPTATNTAIASLIGYTIQEIDAV